MKWGSSISNALVLDAIQCRGYAEGREKNKGKILNAL